MRKRKLSEITGYIEERGATPDQIHLSGIYQHHNENTSVRNKV